MPAAPAPSTPIPPQFRDFLGRKGLRLTGQRLAICDAALAHPEHFTAEQLLTAARQRDRSVSRATVYRTLPILTESGLLREIDVGSDYKFYLANRGGQPEQAQVVCLDCEHIFEIDAPFLGWYASSIAGKVGLHPESIRLQVRGRCRRLQETGDCKFREPSKV